MEELSEDEDRQQFGINYSLLVLLEHLSQDLGKGWLLAGEESLQ